MAKIAINFNKGTLQKDSSNDIIVGIDLGTTNSLVAYIDPCTNKPVCIAKNGSSSLIPSVIHFGKNEEITVGTPAKALMIAEPERTIFSVKRLMGKAYKDIANYEKFFTYNIIDDQSDALVKIQVGSKFYSPIELSSLILKELKQLAEVTIGKSISKAVITVPAYFNDAQRQATKDAGKLAGLDVLRIINEPTAASLAYGIGVQATTAKTVAVYDLGGGTFDVSMLRIQDGVFEVLSTNGDTFLGGDDMDKAIVDHWIHGFGLTAETALTDSIRQAIRLKAEEAKKHLTKNELFESELADWKLTLSKATFEALIQPLVAKTITCCNNALKDAKLTTADIDEVIMVGGSTRIPFVKAQLAELFKRPVYDDLNPDEVVALGAAVQADILAGNQKDLLLLDITPLSLGIETMGGLMDVIIPRNTKIPVKAARTYTTSKDGQSQLKIAVYQGERDLVAANRKLAEFILQGIPGMPANLPKVEIQFLINADGILRVTAKELRSGIEQSIEVKPQYGLSDAQVEQMLLESIDHAKEDMALRGLVEARTEAEQLIFTAEKFLTNNGNLLTPTEVSDSQQLIDELKNNLSSTDRHLIHAKIEALNTFTKPFAERVMDIAISSAMKGKKIDG